MSHTTGDMITQGTEAACHRAPGLRVALLHALARLQSLLTVYFGTPNMSITLWFGFVYGTNLPLGTLII
jgi:hypothetical protein